MVFRPRMAIIIMIMALYPPKCLRNVQSHHQNWVRSVFCWNASLATEEPKTSVFNPCYVCFGTFSTMSGATLKRCKRTLAPLAQSQCLVLMRVSVLVTMSSCMHFFSEFQSLCLLSFCCNSLWTRPWFVVAVIGMQSVQHITHAHVTRKATPKEGGRCHYCCKNLRNMQSTATLSFNHRALHFLSETEGFVFGMQHFAFILCPAFRPPK